MTARSWSSTGGELKSALRASPERHIKASCRPPDCVIRDRNATEPSREKPGQGPHHSTLSHINYLRTGIAFKFALESFAAQLAIDELRLVRRNATTGFHRLGKLGPIGCTPC